jgi:alpha-D-xyloside xylohydrolase
MRQLILFGMILTLVLSSCTNKNYRKTEHGIIVNNGRNSLALEVMSSGIIHVFASEGIDIPDKKSLIVQDDFKKQGRWSVKQLEGSLELSTDLLRAIINLKTLEVQFNTTDGKTLLKELAGGGKTFVRELVNGDTVLSVRQVFEPSLDEALYGLGQHQDRLMDIKGRELSFNQRNREIFIPFLSSTKGYGILWDNYSWTRFGSLSPSAKIPETLLYDLSGKFGGLTPSYFSDEGFSIKIKTGEVQGYPFELPGEFADQVRSVRYEGQLEIAESGEYQIENKGKQQFRLWIDGLLIRDFWSSFVFATDYTRLELEPGKHSIKMEWSRSIPLETMDLTWRTPAAKDEQLSFWSQAGKGIDYYFVYGPSMDDVIAGYRELTGTAPILPKWAYGFWQSRERYQSQDELIATVAEFRKLKIPMDVIVQDWQYWRPGEWGSHEFDTTRFPDPKMAFDKIHSMNAKLMISVWPKFYSLVKNFRELHDSGYIYPYNLQDSTRDWLGFVSVYYDAYNPHARDLYWKQINKTLVPTGVDAWWMDASEPEVISDASPSEMALRMNPNYFGSGTEYLNAYSMFNSRGIYENQRITKPEARVCILTRSGFAGQQKYAAISWSGDITSRWDVLKAQIPAGLSFSISGLPYWTTDIGAFSVDYPGGNENQEYKELFTRWYQFGTFCPIFRVHGSNTPREMWHFGDESDPAFATQLVFDKLRYRMLPYIYSLASEVCQHHYTIMRPLVMDFPEDKVGWNIQDEYMFGPAFLVNPVTEKGAVDRPVYLPVCAGWYDFWYGHFLKAGNSISASAPLHTLPLFIRAGSILPLGPDLQYTSEKPADTIRLLVYTGAPASFELYEDEGINYNYEKGEFSRIPIQWDEDMQTLEIGDRDGKFPGMLETRVFEISFVTPTRPVGYNDLELPDKVLTYTGKITRVQVNK